MPTVRKMWYLKTTVTGEAERLIRHIDLKDENYLSAWGILVDSYNNPRHVTDTILNRFLHQNTVSDDPRSLKDTYITTIESLASLKGLGIDVSSWDTILIAIIKQKLDLASRALYEQSLDGLDLVKNASTKQMFATHNQIELQAVCMRIPSTMNLDGSGLLSLSPGCTESQLANIRFGNITTPVVEDTLKSARETATQPSESDELDRLQQRLAKLKDTAWSNQFTSVHHQVAAYAALAISIILIMAYSLRRRFFNWKPRQRICNNQENGEQPSPEPTPHTHANHSQTG
ncbi:hypothetical protein KR084_002001, partial [Drosophila pseudotakahashii]